MADSIPLIVTAATGYLSEIVGIVDNPHPDHPTYRIEAVVVLDTTPELRQLVEALGTRLGVPVLDHLPDAGTDGCAVAVTGGSPDVRAELSAGREVATLVHRDTTIGPWVDLAPGVIVSPGARITGNVSVGAGTLINTGAVLSHDDVVGAYVTISPSATLCGGVTVGDRSTVFAGATVMPGCTIGRDAVVGAGALVNGDVADNSTVVGVPARPLGR